MSQPQHLARPSFDEIDGTPSTGLSVTSETPVLKKSRPGLGWAFCQSSRIRPRLRPHGRHQQRILLGGRADDAGSDILHARAAAIDRDDERVLGLAGGPQRAIGASRGRLVDRIDDVDADPSAAASPSRRAPELPHPCPIDGRRRACRSRVRIASSSSSRRQSPSRSQSRAGRSTEG